MSAYRDANSPYCWKDYDKQLEIERKIVEKLHVTKVLNEKNGIYDC